MRKSIGSLSSHPLKPSSVISERKEEREIKAVKVSITIIRSYYREWRKRERKRGTVNGVYNNMYNNKYQVGGNGSGGESSRYRFDWV